MHPYLIKAAYKRSQGLSFWRRGLVLAVFACFACGVSRAQQLTAGYSFTPTDQVTSTKLNNLVGQAIINSVFITGQTPLTSPLGADSFVLYSTALSGLRKATLSSLVPIMQQDPTSMSNLLAFTTLSPGNDPSNLLANASVTTTSNLLNNTVSQAALSNFLALANGATLSNSVFRTFFTNAPASTNNGLATVTDTNAAPVYDPTLNAWRYFRLPMFYNTTPIAMTASTNVAHGLPGAPQIVRWVLVCTSSDAGQAAGDEVPLDNCYAHFNNLTYTYAQPLNTAGANATSVFYTAPLTVAGNIDGYFLNSANASHLMTASKWTVKCYAIFYP